MRPALRRALLAVALALAALVAVALGVLGVVPGVKGRYPNGDPALATAYRAKEACSCRWLQERDAAYCRAWTEASPDVASLAFDEEARTTRSRALLFWSARARFVDARSGCVLER